MHQCVARISTKSLPDEFFHFLAKEGLRAVDLHFHTEASMDAISHVPNVLSHCRKRSLGVAITDHSVIGGSRTSWNLRKKYGAFVIPGLETIGLHGAHTLFYFLSLRDCVDFYEREVSRFYKKNPFFLPVDELELMEKSLDYNAVVVGVPHPFGPGATGLFKQKKNRDRKLFSLMEGLNAVCFARMNDRALRWAGFLGKALTGGSDGHTTPELGNVVTVARGDSIEEYLENVRQGKSMILGKEKNFFDDALHEAWKETIYLRKAKHHGLAERWLAEHFKTEFVCLRSKLKNLGHDFVHSWHNFHTPLTRKRHSEIKGVKLHE